jgi:hypothetical protein
MYKLSREEYRRIKTMSKEVMEKWLSTRNAIMYEGLRKEFENNYKEELQCSIDCFITAIAYTLHFSEETHFGQKRLSSFMEDMLVTVDMFRTGEYKPEEYEEELKKAGIKINSYDYSRIYKEKLKEMESKKDEKVSES